MQESLESIFPKDNPKNTRFAINFFTSIGLGGITENLREYLKNMPRLIMQQLKQVAESESSSGSDSSGSESDSSTSSSSSSSSDESDRDKRKRRRRSWERESVFFVNFQRKNLQVLVLGYWILNLHEQSFWFCYCISWWTKRLDYKLRRSRLWTEMFSLLQWLSSKFKISLFNKFDLYFFRQDDCDIWNVKNVFFF